MQFILSAHLKVAKATNAKALSDQITTWSVVVLPASHLLSGLIAQWVSTKFLVFKLLNFMGELGRLELHKTYFPEEVKT